eukprot:216590_1
MDHNVRPHLRRQKKRRRIRIQMEAKRRKIEEAEKAIFRKPFDDTLAVVKHNSQFDQLINSITLGEAITRGSNFTDFHVIHTGTTFASHNAAAVRFQNHDDVSPERFADQVNGMNNLCVGSVRVLWSDYNDVGAYSILVTEMRGTLLSDMLERAKFGRGRRMPLCELLEIFMTLTNAIADLHAAHSMHRNLELDNIRVEATYYRTYATYRVKLDNFSNIKGDISDDMTRLTSWTRIAPPEAILRAKYDQSREIWELGQNFLTMLCAWISGIGASSFKNFDPMRSHHEPEDSTDSILKRLIEIFKFLGKPNQAALRFLRQSVDRPLQRIIDRALLADIPENRGIHHHFKRLLGVPEEVSGLISLIQDMMNYHAKDRPTANQVLAVLRRLPRTIYSEELARHLAYQRHIQNVEK